MDTSPSIPDGFSHTGSAHYARLRARAQELALLNGRNAEDPSGADLVQARAELAGQESPIDAEK